jgi:hypothetical protein
MPIQLSPVVRDVEGGLPVVIASSIVYATAPSATINRCKAENTGIFVHGNGEMAFDHPLSGYSVCPAIDIPITG